MTHAPISYTYPSPALTPSTILTKMASPKPPSLLTLSDTRTLSFATYGAPAPSASTPTIFYFHGFPGSRIEAGFWSPVASSLNAHLIAPDRPGFGASTFQPKRTLLSWPRDVLELADHLGIQQFYVMGSSGGAPYALACAKAISRERLLGVAVVSGLYPTKLGTAGMMLKTRVMFSVVPWLPQKLIALALDWTIGKVARDPDPKALKDLFSAEISKLQQADRKVAENEQFKTEQCDSLREALRLGSRGTAWEARLFGTKWGFELEDVRFEGLTLWHGRLDVNCPVGMSEKAVKLMKGAELKLFEEAHLSLPANHAEEVMRHLLHSGK